MKILLAKRRALGDTVLLSSTLQSLTAKFPEVEIHALVPRAFASVLEGNPALSKIFTYEEQGFWPLVAALRSEKYDSFFQLHSSPGTRPLRWLSGAKQSFEHAQNRETEKAYGKHPNALEWDRFFFQKIFFTELMQPLPKIYFREEEKKWAHQFWVARGAEARKIVFLGTGASRSTKRWPAEHFARFAELVRDRYDLIPAILHGEGEEDAQFAGEVLNQLRVKGFRPQNHPGEKGGLIFSAGLGVRELAAALSVTLCYVGNDSGPKHIAVASGIPSFTFFGPEDPVEWHPYSTEEHPLFFLAGLQCRKEDQGRWCGIPVCVQERHRCMRDLDPLDALEVFRKRLGL